MDPLGIEEIEENLKYCISENYTNKAECLDVDQRMEGFRQVNN